MRSHAASYLASDVVSFWMSYGLGLDTGAKGNYTGRSRQTLNPQIYQPWIQHLRDIAALSPLIPEHRNLEPKAESLSSLGLSLKRSGGPTFKSKLLKLSTDLNFDSGLNSDSDCNPDLDLQSDADLPTQTRASQLRLRPLSLHTSLPRPGLRRRRLRPRDRAALGTLDGFRGPRDPINEKDPTKQYFWHPPLYWT